AAGLAEDRGHATTSDRPVKLRVARLGEAEYDQRVLQDVGRLRRGVAFVPPVASEDVVDADDESPVEELDVEEPVVGHPNARVEPSALDRRGPDHHRGGKHQVARVEEQLNTALPDASA